jgi:RND family efflux transporter MFP subunit
MLVAALAARVVAGDPIRASGLLTPLQEVEVGSETLGTIIWIADEGSVVSRGEPLVKLRDEIERHTVELRKAQVSAARHAVERYKKDYESVQLLHKQQIIHDEEMRTREFNYLSAQDRLAEAVANEKLSIETLARRTIHAPTNCVVVRQLKKIGETLVVSAGLENIVFVVHLDSLCFVAYPDAKFVGQIKVGQKAEVSLPQRGQQPVVGEVIFVDPLVDAKSGSFRVKVQIQNPGHKITPGLHGIATFLTEK